MAACGRRHPAPQRPAAQPAPSAHHELLTDFAEALAHWEGGGQRAKATERERITRRAQQIGQSTSAASDTDNWLRAERQIQAEHRLIAERARHAWAGTPRWLRAEQELTVEGVIPLPDDI